MPPLSLCDRSFASLIEVVYALTGVTLDESKRSLVTSRVSRRLRATGLDEVTKYLELLEGPNRDDDEVAAFIDTLTTHKTSFFRTRSVWTFLEEDVRGRLADGNEVRVWSAASSSGQEPYSLAMLLESQRSRGHWHVTATDVSPPMVERTRNGVFTEDEFPTQESVPCSLDPSSFFKKTDDGYQASPVLKSNMRFAVHNLMCAPIDRFDIILLRNVIIYFSETDRARVIENCTNALKPNGLLILGEAESLSADQQTLDYEAPCIYRLKE